jgi:hypothetical protein
MNPQYEFEDIDDYLHDRMSASDRAAFEEALQSDAGLVRRVEALRAESKVLRMLRNEHLLTQLNDWSADGDTEKKTETPSGDKAGASFYRNWRRIAWIVVVLGVVIVLVKNSDLFRTEQVKDTFPVTPIQKKDTTSAAPAAPTRPIAAEKVPTAPTPNVQKPATARDYSALAANTYVEEDFSQTLMGAEEEASEMPYDQAVRLYGARKYREALQLLATPDKNREQDALYLRGYTYYHLGQYAKAEADFRKFRDYLDSDRKLDAIWCEVFCLAKQLPASRKRLDTVLQEITSNPKHPYYDRAKALETALQQQ